jgi:type IV pilus assembly protein PilY1
MIHNGYTDFGTKNTYNLDVDHPAIAWDTSIETGAKVHREYVTPISPLGACSKIYTVNMMFQVSNQDDDSDNAIENPVSSGGFGSPQQEFADVIQYLNDADLANGSYGAVPDLDDKQNVISYFIVDETKINTLTKSYARAGGTGVPSLRPPFRSTYSTAPRSLTTYTSRCSRLMERRAPPGLATSKSSS